jgi:hypothetical protein
MKTANKRKHFRLEKEALVSIMEWDPYLELKLKRNKTRTHAGSLKNISAGGVLIETPHFYPPGTIVKLEIEIEGWKGPSSFLSLFETPYQEKEIALSAPAKVVRAEKISPERFEIGVEFLGMDPATTNEISDYLLKQFARARKERPS